MNNVLLRVRTLHDLFVRAVSSLQSLFLLFVRLYWGWQFAQSGWGRLHNLDRATEYFASLNLPLPGPTAAFVSSVELVGGILLAVGLFSRISALALTVDMVVAYITAEREALFSFFSNPGKFYTADPYTFLFAALLILIFGPGTISLDTLLGRRFWQRAG